MECPKCGLEVDDKTTVCPNCKKVLKMSCPVCMTLNETSTCKKCGYVIISKCNKCGKVNQTFTKKCKNCGFSTEKSVILNEANGDDFVMLTIEFPNLDEIKTVLGNRDPQAFTKFKTGLDKIIHGYADTVEIRRQIISGVYILRFLKDYTFNSSAESSVNAVKAIADKIANLNVKLIKKKNTIVRCNMNILKRTVESDPENYKSGLSINLVPPETKDDIEKILNGFQLISDPKVMAPLEKDYTFNPLNSIMIDGEMVMFYEMDIKPLIELEIEPEEADEIAVPHFVQNLLVEQDKLDGIALGKLDLPTDPDAIYDIEPIKLEGVRSDFTRTENIDVFFHVLNRLQEFPKGILAIKTAEIYKPYSLKIISMIQSLNLYKSIVTITCYDEMKYSPYSFFRELVAAIFEYTISQKLFSGNDFSMFKQVDPDGLIKDLVTLSKRDVENPEDTRYVYFDLFLTLLQAIPKTLIFIDNFDKIDESSYDVLKYLFEAFDNLDISYLLSYEKDFSLHRNSHFLLTKDYYTEINLKPTPFEKIIEENKIYFKNILDHFYFNRIAKYAGGSILYLDVAIQYLIESGVFAANDDCIEIVSNKTVIVPSNLNKLMKRRLDLLQDDADAMRFLTAIALLGTRVDMKTADSLGYAESKRIIDKLSDMGYIYLYNNALYFPNYNILRGSLLESVSGDCLHAVAKELFDKVFDPSMPSPAKAYLYSLLGKSDEERQEWEALAQVNLSLGDFSAYLNCTDRILQILDKETDPEIIQANEEYKLQLYENISVNLYDYVPDRNSDIAQATLSNLEQSTDGEKIIILCNKMIQGCLISGNFNQALELTHKVLSMLPASSLNPAAPNFNHYFFLMSLIHIQILFNIGALKECMELGLTVLNVVSDSSLEVLKPDYFNMEQFRETICDSIGYVALANVLTLSGNVQEFLNLAGANFSGTAQSYGVFVTLQEFIHGKKPEINIQDSSAGDKFCGIISRIMNAFTSYTDDYNKFADEIYQAKIQAKRFMLHQIELFCDLLIAYAYMKLGSYKKADDIFFKLIKTTNNNGMSLMLYASWYMMSELNLLQGKYDAAFGILNNSIITMERSSTANEYLLMLFKYNMFRVLKFKQRFNHAQISANQAKHIADKYGIDFEFDTELPAESDWVQESIPEAAPETAPEAISDTEAVPEISEGEEQ
ncbi:MAG: hypothetical protein LBK53_03120 [Heliobacteriaceae bacterium]|jgi:predicted RNA-binding Zn-ribbon protein involved in translation (DUF1610 family)|nr:hypothetical protein [Heliobacteriaceae bacterium]